MADRLSINKTAYTRLESGETCTWAKYIQEILDLFEISIDDFFKDIGQNINIKNKTGSYGGNVHFENLFAENKDKTLKIEQLYEERLKDKDLIILEKDNLISELKEVINIHKQK
jgi:hypothetical protein